MKPVFFTMVALFGSSVAFGHTCSENLLYEKPVKGNGFTVDRDLNDYAGHMHPKFVQDLFALKEGDIFLGGGAGRAMAEIDYLYEPTVRTYFDSDLKRGPLRYVELPPVDRRAKVVAVGYKRPPRSRINDHALYAKAEKDPRFQYIEGDIADLPKKHPELLKRVKLIADRYGILKYTHLQKSLEIYFSLLEVGGKIHFSSTGGRIFVDGKELGPVAYFSSIKGARLEYELGSYSDRLSAESMATFVLEKTSDRVEVPELKVRKTNIDPQMGPETEYDWLP